MNPMDLVSKRMGKIAIIFFVFYSAYISIHTGRCWYVLWHQFFTINFCETTKGALPDMGWIGEDQLESTQIGRNHGGCGLGSRGLWNGLARIKCPQKLWMGFKQQLGPIDEKNRWQPSFILRIRKIVLWVGMASRKEKHHRSEDGSLNRRIGILKDRKLVFRLKHSPTTAAIVKPTT